MSESSMAPSVTTLTRTKRPELRSASDGLASAAVAAAPAAPGTAISPRQPENRATANSLCSSGISAGPTTFAATLECALLAS